MSIFQVTTLFYVILVVNSQKETSSVNLDNCKKAYTLGYGYKIMYHILGSGEHKENKLIFKFYIKAANDAHILFTTRDTLQLNDDPAYEIVIGAGRNTFSVIRRQQRKSTQASVNTPNILSSEDFRGFWISMGRDGLVEVGKEGEESPFLFWMDPEPLLINYFGFCNWGKTVGQWAFSCPKEIESEKVETNLTTTEKLRNILLTHYDPFTRPVINEKNITTIFIQMQNRAIKLNEKKSTMSVTASVQLNWHDQKIHWNPQVFDNISKLHIAHHELWVPSFVLFNSIGSANDIFVDAPLTVTPNGTVFWNTQMNVDVRCNLDLSLWPYDTQNCGVLLGFWEEQEYLDLQCTKEIDNEPYITDSQWEILKLEFQRIKLKTPWINNTDDINKKVISIHHVLQRNNPLYKAVFGAPLLAISIMTLLPFWISPLNSHKLNIVCLSLVVMTIFVVGLAKIMPAPSDHVPKLVRTYSHGMLAVTFSLLTSVSVIYIARSDHAQSLPQKLQKIVNAKFIQMMLLLPTSNQKANGNYGNLLEAETNIGEQETTTSALRENSNVQQQWILFAQVIDRLAFLIYTIYLCTVFIVQI